MNIIELLLFTFNLFIYLSELEFRLRLAISKNIKFVLHLDATTSMYVCTSV